LFGVDWVLEETVTHHHLREFAELAALVLHAFLHHRCCRSAFPFSNFLDQPWPHVEMNSLLFFLFALPLLTLTGEEAHFLQTHTVHPAWQI
jgi:hypothetical protein